MSFFDFIVPANTAGSASEMAVPALYQPSAPPAEPFDKLMNRALTKPARDPGEKYSAVKKPANPAPVRKPKPSDGPDSGAASNPGPADSVAAKPTTDASGHDDSTSTGTDTGKETAKQNKAASADTDNAAAMQALAASVAMDQTPVITPDVSKAVQTGTEVNPVGAVGAEPGSATAALEIAGAGLETSGVPEPKDLKPGPKEPVATGKKLSGATADPAKKSSPEGGAIPIQALLDQAKDVKEIPANTADAAPAKDPNLPLATAGTSGAEQSVTMKNADQAKIAGAPEQSLPGVTLVAAAVQEAFRPRPTAKASARAESPDAVPASSSATAAPAPSPVETSSANLISVSSQTELRTRALDRTHDILALHGMQMKQSSTDSLQVVIKPGAGLQLSLQMKQTSDGIEAQAILQQGNFKDLNQHWPELQQRLEERGIKLAPLGQDAAMNNSRNEDFQRQSRPPAQEDAARLGAFAGFATASAPVAGTVSAPRDLGQGWESWA